MAAIDFGDARKLGWTLLALEEALAAGMLDPDKKYEILRGELYEKMGQNWPHSFAISALAEAFASFVGRDFQSLCHQPLRCGDDAPEPDFALIRGSFRSRTWHPKAEEAALVVEVAESSIAEDRNLKSPIYAAAGAPVYWIVDLTRSRVEVYSRPEAGRYLETRIFEIGDEIPPPFESAPAMQVSALITDRRGPG